MNESKFKKLVSSTDYISNPLDFYYTNSPESVPLVEGLRIIYIHNNQIIENMEKENTELGRVVTSPTVVSKRDIPSPVIAPSKEVKSKPISSSIIDIITGIEDLDSLTNIIDTCNSQDLAIIKLYFHKQILLLKKEIIRLLAINPLSKIDILQAKIEDYTLILDYINTEEQVLPAEEIESSRIILLPNTSNSSYLYEDILNYLDKAKEIKNALDKILNNYFGKDSKPLRSYSNLYEYTHPNGIRILYSLLPNNKIGLSLIFYKDKTRSIKISKYYEEALKRLNESKLYVESNINNPDFYIEQLELIGELYSALEERIPLSLRKEDD